MCKTLMQILWLLIPLHISVYNLAIPVPNLPTPKRTQETAYMQDWSHYVL